jgi:hypothetical protein
MKKTVLIVDPQASVAVHILADGATAARVLPVHFYDRDLNVLVPSPLVADYAVGIGGELASEGYTLIIGIELAGQDDLKISYRWDGLAPAQAQAQAAAPAEEGVITESFTFILPPAKAGAA